MFSTGISTVLGLLIISGANALGPLPINLGTAGGFTILAKTGISTVPSSLITGNIGVSPASATALTGFSLILNPAGTSSLSTQIVGSAFAASYTSPTPSQLTTAVLDMQLAFVDGNSRVLPTALNLLSGNLISQTITPGLYKWTSSVTVGTTLTLKGLPTDVWIFQIANNLLFNPGTKTILQNGALAKNVFWVVSGSVTLSSSSLLQGVILGKTNAALSTGASVNGRILVQTAATLQQSTVKPI